MTRTRVPRCERCGGPATNVNRHGEHTGVHTDLDQCLGEMTRNIAMLAEVCAALLDEQTLRSEAHGEICETDPCGKCKVRSLIEAVRS
jgi:hypothetical protein